MFCYGITADGDQIFTIDTKRRDVVWNRVRFDERKNCDMTTLIRKIPKYWLFQAMGWGILILINLFFFFTFDRLDLWHFGRLIIAVTLGVIISHLMRYTITRTRLMQQHLNRQIYSIMMLTFVFALMLGLIESGVIFLAKLRYNSEIMIGYLGMLVRNSFNGFVILFMWNSIYFMYHYIEKSRSQQLDTLKLQNLVKELELKTIKSHINPHFIFNALNSIRALVDENPSRARDAITELSNILRSSMHSQHQETVTLERELDIVRDYLALEHIRFEDRLQVEYDIDEDTLDMPVPPMMLQTLVENAIKHGISKNINGGVVRIESDLKGDNYELIVRNSGKLNGSMNSEGFGLSSTANRLGLLFGDGATFTIRNTSDMMVEARVSIPSSAA